MKNKMLILLSGKQGSGKTTTANMLEKRLKEAAGTVYRTRFAKVLYEAHDAVRDILRSYKIDIPEKSGFLLQIIGTEYGRNTIDSDIWVKTAKSDILRHPEANYVIIDDLRFKNEFNYLESLTDYNILRVRLDAPREIRKARCDGWRNTENHPSETELDDMIDQFGDQIYDTSEISVDEVVRRIYSTILSIEYPMV